jgi:hypothetical protein
VRHRGHALLDAILALAIISTAGLTSLSYVSSLLQAEGQAEAREAEFEMAERLLITSVLLTRAELEQRLGVRESNGFLIWVDRPEPELFRVGVSVTSAPATELVVTLLWRPRE